MVNLNRVAFNIFGIDIYWYGVIIASAIVLCVLLAMLFCKLKKLDTIYPLEIFLAIIPIGILSARLFSVIFEDGLTLADYFNFRTGGMSILGAVIGGAVGMFVYKYIRKKSFFFISDITTSVLLLGQSIGRWGNYFNGEVYGKVITDPSWQVFPFAVNIDGTWFEALFFYEFVLNFIGFVICMLIFLKTDKPGLTTGIYFVYYGLVRLILEPRRSQEFILKWGNVPISQLISAVFLAIGVAIIVYITIKSIKEKRSWKKSTHNAN